MASEAAGPGSWRRARPPVLLAVFAGLLAVALPFMGLSKGAGLVLGNGLQLGAAATAAIVCLLSGQRRTGNDRTGWMLLGLGAASWALGQAIWTWHEVVQGIEVPTPSLADLGYLLLYPPAIAGLLLLSPLPGRHGTLRVALVLDGLIAALAAFVLAWPFLLEPAFEQAGDPAAATLSVAYPLADILLISLVGGILLRGNAAWRSGLGLAYTAFFGLLLADGVYASGIFAGTYATGTWADAGWIVGFLLLATGALAPNSAPGRPSERYDRLVGQVLPVAAVAIGMLAYFLHAELETHADTPWLVGLALLVVLAMVRQTMAAHDYATLSRDREAAQARYVSIVDGAAEGILRTTLDGRILLANGEFARIAGYDSVAALLANVQTMDQLYRDPEERRALLERVAATGVVSSHEVLLQRPNGQGRWVSVNLRRHTTAEGEVELHEFVRDITDTHLLAHDLKRTRRTLLVISRFNQALVRAGDETVLLQGVCESLTTEGGYRLAWVGLAVDDAQRSVRPLAHSGFEEGYVDKVRASWSADDQRGRGPTGTCIREGKTQVAQDILQDPRMAPWRADAVTRGYAASCSLFLDLKEHGRGALMVYAPEPMAFGPDEVKLLEDLAADLAYGVLALRERAGKAQAEAQRRDLEALFNATVQASLEGIITMDGAGHVRGFNPAAERLFGYALDEARGQTLADLIIPPEARQQHRDGLARRIKTGQGRLLNKRVEVEAMRRDGTRFPVELTIIPIDVQGERMFAGFLRDVTAEHGAREATNRLAAIVESSSEAIFSISGDGQVLSWNRGAEEVFGFTAAEAIGQSIDRLMVPADRMAECVEMLGFLKRGEPMPRREAERVRKDGRRITVSVALSPVRDARGQVVAGAVTAFDVTDQKTSVEALRTSEARLREAQRTAMVGSWELDLVKNELWWSDENYRIFGVEPGAFLATYEFFLDTIHPDDREAVNQAYTTSVATKVPYGIEHRLVMKDGSVKWVYERCETFYGPDGKPTKSVGTTQDITERKHADEARQELERKDREVKRLEELNRMRMDFLNTAAHDLKTPLTPLKLQMAALRTRGSLDPMQKASLDIMDRNVNRFQVLVEDMLDAARLQAGRLTLRREAVAFAPLIQEAVASFQEAARAVGLQVEVDMAPDVRIDADPAKCMQVLMNLVSNAVKYTPQGGRIQVRLSANDKEALLRVTDTGLGMTAEQLGGLFQAFVRLHEGQAGVAKGTGLGLYISKGIVESHGGRIWAESDGPGRGSTFSMAWPLAAAKPVAGASAKASAT